ncbi:Kunitz/Bovine pancreatic trypsin inhibitor domain protein, partial [Ostertagia ostertagi]
CIDFFFALIPLALAQKECLLAKDSGFICDEQAGQRFYYDAKTKRCQPFYYKGCGGNGNAFMTRDECTTKCSGVKGTTAVEGIASLSTLLWSGVCKLEDANWLAEDDLTSEPSSCWMNNHKKGGTKKG